MLACRRTSPTCSRNGLPPSDNSGEGHYPQAEID
jgi:hypothetical protein